MGEIAIVLGRFGSGKTEFALNYACQGARQGKRVVLADLDLVNPYFTSGLQAEQMQEQGVSVLASVPTDETVELPPEIYSVFGNKWDLAVLDIGGDPVGARVLGSLFTQLEEKRNQIRTYYVVNVRRPMSNNTEEICMGIEKIERAARIRVDYLVNNTNLGKETDFALLQEGACTLKEVSRNTGIPVKYVMGLPTAFARTESVESAELGTRFPIEQLNRPSWIDKTSRSVSWSKYE